MVISRLTATQARPATATKMVDLDLPASHNRGKGQTALTQEKIYYERTEEQGIESKFAANAPSSSVRQHWRVTRTATMRKPCAREARIMCSSGKIPSR